MQQICNCFSTCTSLMDVPCVVGWSKQAAGPREFVERLSCTEAFMINVDSNQWQVVCLHCKMDIYQIHPPSVLVMPVYSSSNKLQENNHYYLMIILITRYCILPEKTVHKHFTQCLCHDHVAWLGKTGQIQLCLKLLFVLWHSLFLWHKDQHQLTDPYM